MLHHLINGTFDVILIFSKQDATLRSILILTIDDCCHLEFFLKLFVMVIQHIVLLKPYVQS